LSFKEVMIHASVTLRNSIVKQQNSPATLKQPEIPIEKNNDCVDCKIF